MGAKVINLSLSTGAPSMALTLATNFACQQGAVVIAAYGNKGLLNPTVFPADLANVVSVAATDVNDKKASFSNWGQPADVGAPGVDMVGPYGPGGWVTANGTSFATPLVSGQAALLLSKPGGVPALNVAPAQKSQAMTNLLIASSVNISAANNGDPGFPRVDIAHSLI